MKLVFICPQLRGYGGTETVLTKVVNYLEENSQYEISVILTSKPENQQWLSKIKRVVNVEMVSHSKLLKGIKLAIIMCLLPNNAKVVILGANIIPFANRVRRIFNKHWKIISWIHYSLLNQKMFNPNNIIFADEHWAISSSIKKQMIRLGVKPKKVKLIYNPIDVYKGPLNKPDRYNNHNINIAYVGRILFAGQKNLKELFQAVAQLKQQGYSVRVVLYGNGPDLLKCQRFAKSIDISDCLEWRGWSSNVWYELVHNVHPQALVLTSKFEGLPMVMLEAMSHGIPCVTSRFDGYDDILNENKNGYSYSVGNVENLSRCLKKNASNPINPRYIVNTIKCFYNEQYFIRLLNALQ